MAQGNEEVVREYWAALDGWLAGYWADPERPPIDESPELEAILDRMTEDIEWDWPLGPEVFRGREELVRGAGGFLETVVNWRIDLEEAREGRDGTVFTAMRVHITGRESGAPVEQMIYAVVTIRDGLIARIKDHTERGAAEAAAGLDGKERP
jgi:ketosteroid isomerase-like protein